jgi:hypothetical protein
MPVFMPWAPVGGWMCAASPAMKTPYAVPVGQPVADPEHRGPPQVAGSGRLGGEPVEHCLDVVRLGSPAALDPVLHLTRRSGRQLVGDQHGHSVTPPTKARGVLSDAPRGHQYTVVVDQRDVVLTL